jgi:hypothetical protein
MRVFSIIAIITICYYNINAQKSRYEGTFGLGSNLSWLSGRNELDIKFSKKISPVLNFSVGYILTKNFRFEFGGGINTLKSHYIFSTIDENNNQVELKFGTSSAFLNTAIGLTYKPFLHKNISLGLSTYYSLTMNSSYRFLNYKDFPQPVLLPYIFFIKLSEHNFGISSRIIYSLYLTKLDRLDFEIAYNHGLTNANEAKANALYTRSLSLSCLYGFNLKPRKR